jgi:hypothetical protein
MWKVWMKRPSVSAIGIAAAEAPHDFVLPPGNSRVVIGRAARKKVSNNRSPSNVVPSVLPSAAIPAPSSSGESGSIRDPTNVDTAPASPDSESLRLDATAWKFTTSPQPALDSAPSLAATESAWFSENAHIDMSPQ